MCDEFGWGGGEIGEKFADAGEKVTETVLREKVGKGGAGEAIGWVDCVTTSWKEVV